MGIKMYICHCGIEVDLNKGQWDNLAKNLGGVEKKKCKCGKTLVVYGDIDEVDGSWYVSLVDFE